MGFATQHEYSDGQELECAKCGGQARVKLFRPGEVAIATPGSMGARACICDECGKIFCHPCTTTLGAGVPKCDSCGGSVTLPAGPPVTTGSTAPRSSKSWWQFWK